MARFLSKAGRRGWDKSPGRRKQSATQQRSLICGHLFVAFIALGNLAGGEEYTDVTTVKASRPLGGQIKSLAIATRVGNVAVVKSEDQQLHVEAVIRVDKNSVDPKSVSRDFADHVRLERQADALVIADAHRESADRQAWSVSLKVYSPRAVSVAGNTGVGDVQVRYGSGKIELVSGVGDVSGVLDRADTVNARTGVGQVVVTLEQTTGDIKLAAGTGRVELRVAKAAGQVDLRSGKGDVSVRLDRPHRGQLSLESGVGSLLLELPQDSAGKLQAQTSVGSLTLDKEFGIKVRRRAVGASAEGTFGQGQTRYRLRTGVGSIRVKLRQPARQGSSDSQQDANSEQDAASPSDRFSGPWSGGFGNLDGDTRSWEPVTVQLHRQDQQLHGTATARAERQLEIRGRLAGGGARLTVRGPEQQLVTFAAELRGDALVGRSPASHETLCLVREAAVGADKLRGYEGVYWVKPQHRMVIRSNGRQLVFTDLATSAIRVLYAKGNDVFTAGPAFMVPAPTAFTIRFRRSEGEVARLQLMAEGDTLEAERRHVPQQKQVAFESFDGVRLRGTLYLPDKNVRHPAIVWVHGSGRATRSRAGMWPFVFTDLGYAVLTVDKRGVGQSDGTYELPDGGHDNLPHMRRRSQDVLAAMRMLKQRQEIDGQRIGLAGGSQAGWVVPMAARGGQVSFVIVLSGGATALSIENRFSVAAGESSSTSGARAVDSLVEELRSYRPRDPDFRQLFRELPCPGLWLYGARDRSNPSQLCAELLRNISQEHGKDFTVLMFPRGNHGLMECQFGGAAEMLTLSRLVPGLHTSIQSWLESRRLGTGNGA